MAILILLAGMLWAQNPAPPPPSAELLDRIKKMAGSSTLSMEQIKSELIVEFQKDQVHSNESMTFLVGKPRQGSRYSRIIKLVDCRVPVRIDDKGQEPFVVVDFLESSRIFEANLMAHFGPPDSIEVVEPNLTLAASLGYSLKSGWLWFGISPAPARRVISASIHREKKVPSTNP